MSTLRFMHRGELIEELVLDAEHAQLALEKINGLDGRAMRLALCSGVAAGMMTIPGASERYAGLSIQQLAEEMTLELSEEI